VKSAGLIFVFAAFIFAQSRTAHLEADRGQKIGSDFAKAALRALKAIESDNSMLEEVTFDKLNTVRAEAQSPFEPILLKR